jgi:hypothetical protein
LSGVFPIFQERAIWGKGLIFCFRMIKLNFVFLSDFQDGSISFHENSIKKFEYPHPPPRGRVTVE